METNYENKINSIIEEAVTEKTFSLDIINKIKALRDDFSVISKSYELLKDVHERQSDSYKKITDEYNKLLERVNSFEKRESELILREKQLDIQDLKLKHADEKYVITKELFGIVFKNPVVKEQAFKNTSTPLSNNGYVQIHSGSENEGKTTEIE